MAKRLRILIIGATLVSALGQAQDAQNVSKNHNFRVLADEAWEELDSDAIHFKGNFQLIGPHWSVHAEEGTLFGSLNAPRKFVADGNPVLIVVEKPGSRGKIAGQGKHIEYLRSDNTVEITGAAIVSRRGNTMASSMLRWDLTADTINAGGIDGVKMIIDPNND